MRLVDELVYTGTMPVLMKGSYPETPKIIVMKIYAELSRIANANGGLTHSFKGESPKRYVVAIDREQKLPYVEERGVCGYVNRNQDLLRKDGHFFGLWFSDGVWYADVSISTDDFEEAFRIGKEFNQLAIWDNETSSSIDL